MRSAVKLMVHVVTASKRRAPLISPAVEAVIYAAIRRKALDLGVRVIIVNGVADHIQLLLVYPPTRPLSSVIRALKTSSSHAANKHLSGDPIFRWQVGYFAISVNGWNFERVRRYIANQKRHHHRATLLEYLEPPAVRPPPGGR